MPQQQPSHATPTVLKRDRLFKAIECARAGAGLWVSGMAGAGKTTLVSSYLRENRCKYLWYELGRRDADLPSFFSDFGGAIRKVSNRISKDMPLLTAEYLPGTESFVSKYFVKLFNRVDTPLWIVFDNHQDVPPDSDFGLVLMSLLQFAPPGLMVVVISRSDPPPIMARMLAGRKLALIDSNSLAFTESEARQLMRMLAPNPLSEEAMSGIYAASKGWVAGIILLMLRPDQIGRLKLGDEENATNEVFDFIGNEVFSKLEAGEQDFFLKTVLLPHVTAESADVLTDSVGSKAILEKMVKRNFFIGRSLESGSAYQYHPLFRRYLATRFSTRFDTDEARNLQKKAADLLCRAGRFEDAAPLYAKAAEWEQVRGLVLQEADRLISHGRLALLRSWIDLLPKPLVEGDAQLLLWKGICCMPVDPEEGQRFCRLAYSAYAREGDSLGKMVCLSHILEPSVWLRRACEELEGWVAEGETCFESARAGGDKTVAEKLSACMLAALSLFDPGCRAIDGWEKLASELIEESRRQGPHIEAIEWLLYLNSYRGETETARILMSWAEPFLEKLGGTPALLRWNAQECSYHQATARYREGILAAEEGLKNAAQCGIHHLDFVFIGHKLYFQMLKGDMRSTNNSLKHLADVINPDAAVEVGLFHYMSCLNAYCSGDFKKARELARLGGKTVLASQPHWAKVSMRFLLARIHQACGEFDAAAGHLDRLCAIAETSRSHLVRCWGLLAAADEAFQRGRDDKGCDALRQAFRLASRKGVLYHPAIGRRNMSALCARALERDIEPEAALSYIEALELTPPENAPPCKRWPWPVRAYLLGGVSIFCDRQPLAFPRKAQKRPLELFMMLACSGRRGETRDKLADQLWPAAEGDKAEQALSTTLHRLRRLLKCDGAIVQENDRISLSARHCWVDAWYFEDLLELARKTERAQEKISLLTEATALYRGNAPFADSPGADYSMGVQDKLANAFLDLGELLERNGDPRQALNCYRRGILLAPRKEALYQRLMYLLGKQGDRAEAASVYALCRKTFEKELGLSPSKKTTDLHRAIMADREGAD